MGVTIHYRMIADDPRTVIAALKIVKEEAARAGYRYQEFRDEGIAFMEVMPIFEGHEAAAKWLKEAWGGYAEKRFDDVPEEPPFTWIEGDRYGVPFFMWKEIAERNGVKGKPIEGHGVIVYCDTAESFNAFFWKLGSYYICSEFTKTQPFTADEVEAKTRWHKWICAVLKRLERLPWWNFYVCDEAGYYETMDEQKMVEAFEISSKLIWAVSSAIQEAIDEAGLPFRGAVAGKYDVKKLKDKLKDAVRREPRQMTLDDYMNETLDEYGGDPHRLLGAHSISFLLGGRGFSPAPGGRGGLGR